MQAFIKSLKKCLANCSLPSCISGFESRPAHLHFKMKNKFKLLLAVFVISFFLNLLWENLHSLLYDWNKFPLENNVHFYAYRILKSAFIDGLIITFIFLVNSVFRKELNWINKIKKRDYFLFIFLGLIFAIAIEIKAKIFNTWSYNQYMPLIFGIGLTPLIQLSITGILLIIIIKLKCSSN